MNKQTVRDLDAAGKKVLVRVDFNVPIEDGKVTDDSRVRAAIPTIALLLSRGAAVILASHLGRPNGRVVDTYRLRPVAERLSMLLGRYVPITGDALGVGTQDAVNRLKPGQVLMLENLRFHSEEEANDPKFAKTLAGYADVYVNDAFGTAHRAHASTVGITEYLPAYAGLLLEREVQVLSRLLESPERPFAAVLGGAKVSGKINVLDSLTERVDTFVVGGGMANTFLVAKGNTVGKSLLEKDRIDDARRVLEAAEKKGINFVLPVDVIVAKEVTRGAERKLVPAHKIPNSWSAVDVGPQTRELFEQTLDSARTVFWNGPLGVFEVPTFGDGTRAMARYLARRAEEGATVVVGGGDSVAAVEQLGLAPKMTHISTGGGASLEFLENGDLPGIAALLDREPAPAPAGTEPAATTAKQQPGGPAQPAKPVPARVGVRALDATTPIATVSAPGDGAGTSRRPAPASAGRGNGRQPAAKPAGARDTPGRARTTGTGRAAGTTKAATSGRPATTGATAQRRKSAAPAAGAARRSTSAPRRAKAAAPASGRATGKKSATSSTRAGAKATGASKRSAARASAGAKPSTRRGASTGKAATKRTAGKKAAAKRATGAAKPATTRGKATAKPATKRAAAATKPAAKRGTAGSKTGMRSRASGGSSAAKGAKRTGGSAKGDTRRGSGSSGRNTRSTSAKRPSAAKPTQRRSSRTSQRRGTSR